MSNRSECAVDAVVLMSLLVASGVTYIHPLRMPSFFDIVKSSNRA